MADEPIDSPTAVREMRARHLSVALAMQRVGAVGLKELQDKIDRRLPLDMTADEARKLMATGLTPVSGGGVSPVPVRLIQ
jgi:hypothetical protein